MLCGKPEAFRTSDGRAVTHSTCDFSRSPLMQYKHSPAAIALLPLNLTIDHAGARANVGHAAAGFLLCAAAVKATTVIFNLQIKLTSAGNADAHLNVLCICMAADIA